MSTIHINGYGYITEQQAIEYIRQMFEYTSAHDSLHKMPFKIEGLPEEAVEWLSRDRSCIQDYMTNRSRDLMRIADEQRKQFHYHKEVPNGQDTSNQ